MTPPKIKNPYADPTNPHYDPRANPDYDPAHPQKGVSPYRPTTHQQPLVSPFDERARTILELGATLATLLSPALPASPVVGIQAQYAAQVLRDSAPFAKAGSSWTTVVDALVPHGTSGQSIQDGVTRATARVAEYWQSDAAKTFNDYITDQLVPSVADIGTAAKACEEVCTGFASILDAGYKTWRDGTEDCIELALAAYAGCVVLSIGGPAVAVGALIVLYKEWYDFSMRVCSVVDDAINALKGKVNDLAGVYASTSREFFTKSGSIKAGALKLPQLVSGSINAPTQWQKKPTTSQ